MKKILVVEDEMAYLKLLDEQLATSGYEVLEANDGEIGLELAKSKDPDLVLLDIKLPKIDGLTMLDLLRQYPAGKKMKVIILTNLEPDAKMLESIFHDNPVCYFIKSDIKIEELLTKIKEIFEPEAKLQK